MDSSLIFKALSNEHRQQILQWLKDPALHFDTEFICSEASYSKGVCVKAVQDKLGLSQSVTSNYLDMLQKSGLLEMKRVGKWSYYQRNEQTFQQLSDFIKLDL